MDTSLDLNAHLPATQGTKRGSDIDLDANNSDPTWVHNLGHADKEVWQETENHSPAQNKNYEKHIEMIYPPQSKRRVSDNSKWLDDDEPLMRAWSQDPLFTFSELSQGDSQINNQSNSTAKDTSLSESCFFNGLRSKEAWGVAATTSTQKHIYSSPLNSDKENTKLAPFKSAIKHLNSNLRCAHPSSPPKYIPVHQQKKEESQFTRTKLRSSPMKRSHPWKAGDEDSLAMLFTQDSEGCTVIAHGSVRGRSPLKDQSNIHAGMSVTSAHKSLLEEEEEDEILFTQDSQGNLVIKH